MRGTAQEEISTIGLDVEKAVFQIHAISGTGKVVVRPTVEAPPAHLAEFGLVAGIGCHGVGSAARCDPQGEEGGIPAEARTCLMALATQIELVKRQILEMDRRVLT